MNSILFGQKFRVTGENSQAAAERLATKHYNRGEMAVVYSPQLDDEFIVLTQGPKETDVNDYFEFLDRITALGKEKIAKRGLNIDLEKDSIESLTEAERQALQEISLELREETTAERLAFVSDAIQMDASEIL